MERIITALLIVFLIIGCFAESNNNDEKYIVAYFFPRDRIALEEELNVENLTHINYAFADIVNGEIAEGFENDSINFCVMNETKKRNPELKILISVGGWTWSGQFSDMSLTKESRSKFITSAIKFIERHNIDGIDLDWEFPNLEGYGNIHRPEDKENFTYLLKELRYALDEYGANNDKHYLLTIATGAFDDYITNTEIGKVHLYLDFLNIMAYDLYESDYDTIAGHHTALFTNPLDSKNVSADAAVQKYIKEGVPPEKIVLGTAFYGRAFQARSIQNNGLYQPAGPVKERFRASFKNLKSNYINQNGFTRYWDSTSSAPYLFNDSSKIFISYDDEQSMKAKCGYIKQHKLKGAMFWEYQSDFNSLLLNTLHRELKSEID